MRGDEMKKITVGGTMVCSDMTRFRTSDQGQVLLKWKSYHEKCSQEPDATPKAKNTT